MQNQVNNTIVEVGPADSGPAECVTPQELYDHLNLNCGLAAVQSQLAEFITVARMQFEADTDGRAVMPTIYEQHLTGWPDKAIRLERGRVTELTSVKYYDPEEDEQTLEDVVVDVSGVPALVYLTEGGWPATSLTQPRPITIEFIAGWASVADVPADVKLAIKIMAGSFYSQRENYGETDFKIFPAGFARVCDRYRTGIKGY